MSAKVVSINISDKKGVRKKPVAQVLIKENYGIEADAHAFSDRYRRTEGPEFAQHHAPRYCPLADDLA